MNLLAFVIGFVLTAVIMSGVLGALEGRRSAGRYIDQQHARYGYNLHARVDHAGCQCIYVDTYLDLQKIPGNYRLVS